MAYPSCRLPKGQGVKSHTRAAPDRGAIRAKARRRKAAAAKQATAVYWTCARPDGATCGVHHRTSYAAVEHRKRLNLSSYRAGRGRPWDVKKRGPK